MGLDAISSIIGLLRGKFGDKTGVKSPLPAATPQVDLYKPPITNLGERGTALEVPPAAGRPMLGPMGARSVNRATTAAVPPADLGPSATPPLLPVSPRPVTGPDLNRDAAMGRVTPPNANDYRAKKPGFWRDFAAIGLGGLAGMRNPQLGAEAAEDILGAPQRAENRRFAADTAQYNTARQQGTDELNRERQAANDEMENTLRGAEADKYSAEAAALRNPAAKEGVTPEELTIHDLMTGSNGQPRVNPDTQKPYTYLEAYQAVKQAGADTKTPSSKNPMSGTVDGKQAFAYPAPDGNGFVDANTKQPLHNFIPAPSFAETGLYEPTEVPTPSGGMAPGTFNRRTGKTTLQIPGSASIPRAAQGEIDKSLDQARNMDRLDKAQKQILTDAEKRGQKGPAGGGPYLNGPESMQFLANHIAMTLGGVKGARIGKDIIQEHIKARDLDQETEALAQRVLSGGVITYSQARQMISTTEVNRRAIWQQAADTAQQYGVPDAVKLPAEFSQQNQNAPKVGYIQQGYRFKGGDPADQKNWELVKKP